MTIDTPQTLDLFPSPARPSWTEFFGGVRQERTGWRDQEISERHRLWGASCPVVDLDFLLTEIHVGEPMALVEYKHFGARPIDPRPAVFTALRNLADLAAIPSLWRGIGRPHGRFAFGPSMISPAIILRIPRISQSGPAVSAAAPDAHPFIVG
jgi:hypothetical protein